MVRVMLKKRIIAIVLCVALTVSTVSAAQPIESKASGLGVLTVEAIEALIAALTASSGNKMKAKDIQSIEEAVSKFNNTTVTLTSMPYLMMAKKILPIVDSAGKKYIGYITSEFAHEDAVSYDNIDDYFRAMDPAKSEEIIEDPEFICAVPYDPAQLYYLSPSVMEKTEKELEKRGTSISNVMKALKDAGVQTYDNLVSALKDIINGTYNFLVNDQTKAMFDAVVKVVSNAAREVVRLGGEIPTNGIMYNGHALDLGDAPYYRLIQYTEASGYPAQGIYYTLFAWTEPNLCEGDTNRHVFDSTPYEIVLCSRDSNFYYYDNNHLSISENGWSKIYHGEFYAARRVYDSEFNLVSVSTNSHWYIQYDTEYYHEMCTETLGGNFLEGDQELERTPGSPAVSYKGLPNTDALEAAGSTDALMQELATKDDAVPWINSNPVAADAAEDAAEAIELAEQVNLINQGIATSNNLLESILRAINGMAINLTGIQTLLGTGLASMLTGAADRVVEGFRDIYIDDVGDNILEKACTGIENIFEGVGDMTALKEDVTVIREAAEAQVKALTEEDAVAAELATQLGGADSDFKLGDLFNLVYLLLFILIDLLLLFLKCLSLIVTIFKVPASTGFLPEGMVQGLDWIKTVKIANFNISVWDFLFLLIYIVLVFKIVGSIKRHIDNLA